MFLIAIAVFIGALVGAIGIGGVLLVPVLVLLGGIDLAQATPIATASFLFTGVAGTATLYSQRRLQWDKVRFPVVASVPGAVAGAMTNTSLPPSVITVVIAAVLGLTAWRTLRPRKVTDEQPESRFTPLTAMVVGALAGFGSTLTGTGGPVLLIPLMVLARAPVRLAVSASQPIQIPIAVFGAVSFWIQGVLDWQLALVLGMAQGIGAILGASFGGRLSASRLRLLVGWALTLSVVALVVSVIR